KADYAKAREAHLRGEASKRRITIADARANAFKIDWKRTRVRKPEFFGTRSFKAYDLAELRRYIDWTPFFQTWELSGRYPRILEDNVVGPEAKRLFADAQVMLDRMIAEAWV